MPADGTPLLTKDPVHSAERDYENLIRQTPGVTRLDADLDILRLAAIADRCAMLATLSWRDYRATSDEHDRRETTTTDVARQLGDVLAQSFGMSREAALLLDAQIERASQ